MKNLYNLDVEECATISTKAEKVKVAMSMNFGTKYFSRRIGLITRIKFGDRVKNINHSQFFDDTLLIGGASTTIAKRFKSLLDKYMSYSGGMVNNLKSCIYGWNTIV